MRFNQALRQAVQTAPFGMSEIAHRAGMSRAHLYRIMAGSVEPRIDDAREIALACGVDLRIEVVPSSDPFAAVAGRLLLGDSRLQDRAEEVGEWTQRLWRTVNGDRERLVGEAGRAASLFDRADGIGLSATSIHWDVDRLVSAGVASGTPWALSGWAALNAMGHEVESPTVFWTGDVRLVAQLLTGTFTVAPMTAAEVLVLPADASVFVGTVTIEQVVLVDPAQALIDAAGLGVSTADIAAQPVGALT